MSAITVPNNALPVPLDPVVQAPPDPTKGMIIGGALSGAGSLISGGLNMWSAAQNRKWQERMANTSHQREVADLRAAGLNPILSATGGSGAATPSGSFGSMGNMLEGVGSGVSSAAAAKLTRSQVANQTLSTAYQGMMAMQDVEGKMYENELLRQDVTRGGLVTDQLVKDLKLTDEQIRQVEANKAAAEQMKPVYEFLGPVGTFLLDKVFPRLLDIPAPRGHSASSPGYTPRQLHNQRVNRSLSNVPEPKAPIGFHK